MKKKTKDFNDRNYVAKYSVFVNIPKVERDRTKYSRNDKHKELKLDRLLSI